MVCEMCMKWSTIGSNCNAWTIVCFSEIIRGISIDIWYPGRSGSTFKFAGRIDFNTDSSHGILRILSPKDSLPFQKKPAILPYTEPHEFSPRPCSLIIKKHFNIIIRSNFTSYKWPLSLRFFPPKPYMQPSDIPFVPHAPPIPFSLIWSPE